MNRSSWIDRMVLALSMTLVAGCAPSDTEGTAASSQAGPEKPTAPSDTSPTRAALPGLFTIMAGLQEDMAGLERGLWREDFDSIATRATAIEEHPTVPAAEAQAIAGVLGPDMAAFKQADTEVHDLAVRIRELADAHELDGILATKADLAEGCVACHTQFRERIRAGLR